MEENFTCSFDVSGRGTRKSNANINVSYNFVNSSTQENILSGNKTFNCTTNENGVLIYNGGTTIPFKIENEVIQGRYTINVDCSISAVEDNVTFTKNSITITHIENIEKDVWVEFNDYGELIAADLSGLVDGTQMFKYTNIGQITNEDGTIQSITFDYDLSSLTCGWGMFWDCFNLSEFSSDLSSLTDGEMMFYNCSNLTTFSSGLPSLTNGEDMFNSCKLDAASVQNIAETINGDVTDNPRLDLGVDENIVDDSNVKRCFSIILQKGWNVYVNYVQFIEENNN